jgi:hypothetical protein
VTVAARKPAPPAIVHVYQQRIRGNINAAPAERLPPMIVRRGARRDYGNAVEIRAPDGTLVGRFVYSPDKPLDCGARVYFQCEEGATATAVG